MIDWWELYHTAMCDLHWTPAMLAGLTISQLKALATARPPDDGRVTSSAEWQEYLDREKAEADEWACSPNCS